MAEFSAADYPNLPLVVLVDGNCSAALPSMTLPYRSLVIVHTTASTDQAARLAEVSDMLYPTLSDVRLFDCGPATDFDDTTLALSDLEIDAPYRLDYTAGNRVQQFCGVWRHLEQHESHGGGHGLRSYNNNYRRCLVLDGPDADGSDVLLPDGELIGLEMLAALEGFRLERGYGPLIPTAGTDPARVAHDFQTVCRRATEPDTNTSALVTALQQLRAEIDGIPDDVADRWTRSDPSKLCGDALELATACAVAAAGTEESWELEVLVGACAVPLDVPEGSPPVIEFDVLVRNGFTVYAVEVKRSPGNAADTLTRRETYARLAFGTEVRVVTVTGRRPTRHVPQGFHLPRLSRLFNALVPSRRRSHVIELWNHDAWRRLEKLGEPEEPVGGTTVVELAEKPIDEVDLIACGLGAAVGLEAAVGEAGADSVVALTLDRHLEHLPDVPGPRPVSVGVAALSATAAYTVACATGPKVLSLTSGPKSAASGFIRYAVENPETVLLHMDVGPRTGALQRVHLGRPESGWHVRPRRCPIAWDHRLAVARYQPLTEFDALTPAARHIATEAARRNLSVWTPPAADMHTAPHLEYLVLTGPFTTATVSVIGAPDRHGRRIDTPKELAGRSAVLQFEAAAESLLGPQNRNVVVLPPGFPGVDTSPNSAAATWARLAEENDWTEPWSWRLHDGEVIVEHDDRLWRSLKP
ncbi:MAG: hypothetical protein QM809_15370 [Gordonia sp. (in: high G+C Gram-positive bacteria)]|uniref:hypothetical protein n=1 Tax=Gordonia sp. (in: high G+C Gram-positive bacteria) TaxID=84139 RepID=UPI0039E3096C